ncbi:Na+/H+ antiporter subunit E [Rhodopseudomonas sp. NSM]|uniref:Na+/H+ antiporter subunit E n=1 Tax=Rhodopseudomonas sp. NSM TaxID=3457630 RepID=UPI0040365D5E
MVTNMIALMTKLMIALKRFVLLGALWVALTSNDPAAWPVGLLTVAAATLLSLRLLPPAAHRVRLVTLVGLVPGFLAGSLRGGIDVARRAFDPRMPLSPGWLAYLVRLPSGAPRAALGGELSLMPGTLAAGEDGRAMYVHCLDLDQPHDEAIAAEERRIGAGLGLTLDDAGRPPS